MRRWTVQGGGDTQVSFPTYGWTDSFVCQAVNTLTASEFSGHSCLTLKDTIYPELTGSLASFSSSLRAAKARYRSAVLRFVGGVKLVGDNPHNHVSHRSDDSKF